MVPQKARLKNWNLFRGRAFAHGAMGCQIDPSWGGPIELFLVPASATKVVVCVILSVGWCI